MTKKDYIKLAKVTRDTTAVPNDLDQHGIPYNHYIAKLQFMASLCDMLVEDNPRFDAEKFVIACNKQKLS